MLNERRAAILQAVVETYIETAQPVGSSRVVASSGIAVSPATVRNEMTALENEGYVAQPHASAGRIPTDKGYRFFVDHLGSGRLLQPHQARQVGTFFEHAHRELEALLRDASSLLARLTHTAAVVVSAPEPAAEIRSAHLVTLNDRHAMLVVILSNGSVHKPRIDLADDIEPETVADASAVLAQSLEGGTTSALVAPEPVGRPAVDELVARAFAALQAGLANDSTHLYVDGTSNVARSFDGASMVSEILALLEQQLVVTNLLRELMDRRVKVSIGSETGVEELSSCSLVLAPVVGSGGYAGAVAVLGPTRMNYAETLAAVETVSDRLGRALTAAS
jgi:heat-inducible transcriptional repressor